jgi:tetratricopeptide (TPR) repeat protein
MRWSQFENPREEIKRLGGIMRKNPHDPKVYYDLGTVYEFLNDWNMAAFFCGKAIEIDPNNITYYALRAYANSYVGQWKEAMDDLVTIIEMGGDTSDHYVDLVSGTLGANISREYVLRRIYALRRKGKRQIAYKLKKWLKKACKNGVANAGF